MDDVTKAALIGLLRDLLKVLGTILTVHGIVTADQWSLLAADVQMIGGFLLVAIPVLWGIWAKYKAAHVAVVAGARAQARGVPVGSSIAQASNIITQLKPRKEKA